MKKLAKYFLITGSTLSILGLFSFALLFWQHTALSTQNPLLYLIFLWIIFLGYVGVPVLLLGAFIWSAFETERSAQIFIWGLVAMVLATFIPIPHEVTYGNPISGRSIFPYELKYWKYASDFVVNHNYTRDPGSSIIYLEWTRDADFFLKEGYGDVWKEIKETTKRTLIKKGGG